MMQKRYYVYILGNKSGTLYVGMTNDINRRMHEHVIGNGSVFTRKYKMKRLLHLEEYDQVLDAITREKEIKGWRRQKKLDLIKKHNPDMRDLYADEYSGDSSSSLVGRDSSE